MQNDPLIKIYDSLNWSGPEPMRCNECMDICNGTDLRPSAGSHPSSLSHYEAILGRLEEPRTEARILFVLQDPRPDEKNFRVGDPAKEPSTLEPNEHRYFCLTPVAWRALNLHNITGSKEPCWPTPETAPRFLDRYLSKSKCWSYDGFLAYFLYLLRPKSAVVTNLAKCYFGSSQGRKIFERCASVHLTTEASLLQPNLLISFTAQCDQSILNKYVPSLRSVTRLNLFHPASDRYGKTAVMKSQRLISEVEREKEALQRLGYDVPALRTLWEHHVDSAIS